jgi:hypothetical protein
MMLDTLLPPRTMTANAINKVKLVTSRSVIGVCASYNICIHNTRRQGWQQRAEDTLYSSADQLPFDKPYHGGTNHSAPKKRVSFCHLKPPIGCPSPGYFLNTVIRLVKEKVVL